MEDNLIIPAVGQPVSVKRNRILLAAAEAFVNGHKQLTSEVKRSVARGWERNFRTVVDSLTEEQKAKIIEASIIFASSAKFTEDIVCRMIRGQYYVDFRHEKSEVKRFQDSIEDVLNEPFMHEVECLKGQREKERREEAILARDEKEEHKARAKKFKEEQLAEAEALLKRNGFQVTKKVKTKASAK